MSMSAFIHPFLAGLVGDDETHAHLTAEADIAAMLAFEAALARAQSAAGLVPADAAQQISDLCSCFEPSIGALKAGVARDGVVVADLVKQIRAATPKEISHYVHLGATSQDVIDTSLMLRLKAILPIFARRLAALISRFDVLEAEFGSRPLMGYTRMQAAIAITVSDRIRSWRAPLQRELQNLESFIAAGLPLQFGGAAGSLDKFGADGAKIRSLLADELGLADQPQWQSQRDVIASLANLLSLLTGSLGKFGQDVALMAQMGGEVSLAGGGASSAMAHKQNPVAAEVLVSLARFNAVQISGIHQSLVHEQERSGAAWTLEWLILPSILMATGASLRLAGELAGNVRSFGKA